MSYNPFSGMSPYRLLFVAALMLVVIGQVVAMAMLVQSQVRTAQERESLDTSARVAAARCFESSPRRSMDMCRASGTPRQVSEVVDNTLTADTSTATTAANDAAGGVMPVGYGYASAR